MIKNSSNQWRWNLQVFLRLIQRDMIVIRPMMRSRMINIIWWTVLCVYVFEYVGLGPVAGCGLFIAASECASKGFMRAFPNAGRIITDLHGGPRFLLYYLSLPIPQQLVFVAVAVSTSLELMAINIFVLPIAKLILWNSFHLSLLGMVKAGAVFLCAHLFYGSCVLFFASLSNSLEEHVSLFSRLIHPLFWAGGYLFTWHRLYQASPVCAYIDLLNPLVYAFEGMRSAIFNNPESLPVWLCCLMLLMFTVLVGTIGTRRMMKKIDCL